MHTADDSPKRDRHVSSQVLQVAHINLFGVPLVLGSAARSFEDTPAPAYRLSSLGHLLQPFPQVPGAAVPSWIESIPGPKSHSSRDPDAACKNIYAGNAAQKRYTQIQVGASRIKQLEASEFCILSRFPWYAVLVARFWISIATLGLICTGSMVLKGSRKGD